jgi:hypothetical protein
LGFFFVSNPQIQNGDVPDSNIVWYMLGKKLPQLEESLSFLSKDLLPHTLQQAPNLTPTTYEAAEAYLREELKKPEGQRDLFREMCAFVLIAPADDPKVYFRADAMKAMIPMYSGT